jgi:hypothetical protein
MPPSPDVRGISLDDVEVKEDQGKPTSKVKRRVVSARVSDSDDDSPWEDVRPPKQLPKKVLAQALFLLACGIVFCSLGAWKWATVSLSDAVPFLTMGGISFIPGSYWCASRVCVCVCVCVCVSV